MRLRFTSALVLLVLVFPTAGRAQSPDILADDQKLIDYEKQNPEILNTLEYLCDMIGPRLTGSERLKKANEWTASKMKEYGLDNVHLESWTIPEGWERQICEARIIEPNGLPIMAAAWAWTPNTRGKITGPVVIFDPKDDNDLEQFKGKLKNAILLMNRPQTPEEHPSRTDFTRRRGMMGTDEDPDKEKKQAPKLSKRNQFLKDEGAAVVLLDSGKPQMLLNMTGGWPTTRPSNQFLTQLFVVNEHYSMLYRLAKRGIPVTMEVKVQNKFIKGPITVYNTVGEIKGSEKPDEVVICGGHLDSWDLGQGACDNGTGSVTTLETARLIKATGLKPKRTMRFILFSGEEQGLYGSRAYVDAHKDEMSKISAVFINDTGTGKVTGLGLHGNPQCQAFFENDNPILKELGLATYSTFQMGGTDHASFAPKGVPAFWFMQDSADYGLMHHSQSDTFDKAIKADLINCATVMAICAYNTAQAPDMLPRKGTTASTDSSGTSHQGH